VAAVEAMLTVERHLASIRLDVLSGSGMASVWRRFAEVDRLIKDYPVSRRTAIWMAADYKVDKLWQEYARSRADFKKAQS
jgi:hypothetical protein